VGPAMTRRVFMRHSGRFQGKSRKKLVAIKFVG